MDALGSHVVSLYGGMSQASFADYNWSANGGVLAGALAGERGNFRQAEVVPVGSNGGFCSFLVFSRPLVASLPGPAVELEMAFLQATPPAAGQ